MIEEKKGGLEVWAPSITPGIGVELTDEQRLACAFRILAGEGFAENLAGHITWQRGARDALPITVSDSMQDASLSAFWEVFAQEGIRALAFIPLIANGGLIGKLMLYYNSPHEFQPDELQVAQAIAI